MQVQRASSISTTHWLRERAKRIAHSAPYLANDFDMLFRRAVDDRPMALVRTRRIAEVGIFDYCYRNSIKVHDKNGSASLYSAIRNLAKSKHVTRAFLAVCDAVRLEGNRCAHYKPAKTQTFKPIIISRSTVLDTLNRVTEIIERLLLRYDEGYTLGLPQPFRLMHAVLRKHWAQCLAHRREGAFPLGEALELLFRTVVRDLNSYSLAVLQKYGNDGTLRARLPGEEEDALRRLRNLGLITHDGQWLFRPTRSRRVDLTPQGNFLLALRTRGLGGTEEELASHVVKQWQSVEMDKEMLAFLDEIQYDPELHTGEKAIARRARNLYLIRHTTYFLEAASDVALTDLGYYLLGRHKPD